MRISGTPPDPHEIIRQRLRDLSGVFGFEFQSIRGRLCKELSRLGSDPVFGPSRWARPGIGVGVRKAWKICHLQTRSAAGTWGAGRQVQPAGCGSAGIEDFRAQEIAKSDRQMNLRQGEVVLKATRQPGRVFTMADHQAEFSVSYGTARANLLGLEAGGYLLRTKVGNRFDFLAGGKVKELARRS